MARDDDVAGREGLARGVEHLIAIGEEGRTANDLRGTLMLAAAFPEAEKEIREAAMKLAMLTTLAVKKDMCATISAAAPGSAESSHSRSSASSSAPPGSPSGRGRCSLRSPSSWR